MRWGDVINLISIVYSQNSIGDITETPTSRQVFANQKSIRQSEFYQSQANGLKPEIMFEIRAIDYADEKKLSFNSLQYNIIRTYSKNGEILELICNRLIGG
jgi:SPP1 family predicted phage head-tail adaptor